MAKHGLPILKRLKVLMSNLNTNTDARTYTVTTHAFSSLWSHDFIFFKSGLTSNVKATSHFSISVICSAASRIRIILLIPVLSIWIFVQILGKGCYNVIFCICMKKPFGEKGQRRLEDMNNTKAIRPTSLNTNVQYNNQNDVTGKYFIHPTTCS